MGKVRMSRDLIPVDKDVYTLARERCANLFRQFDHVFVSFSGGKDSTAVLNVALETLHADEELGRRHLPLRVVFYDEEAIPWETVDYVERVAQRPDVALEWYCLPTTQRNACSRKSPWWWTWAPEARDKWARPLPPRAITELEGFVSDPPEARMAIPDINGLLGRREHGLVCMLMGIRAQESLIRRRAVTRKDNGENYLIKLDTGPKSTFWKGYPIYDWNTEDVWTAPAKLGWDYNRAYDLMEMAGISHSLQRCSPAFGEEPLQKLWVYASCFPDVWEKMVDRVPGVGAAARYARTELYSFHGRPEKPAGMPWPDFILHYVAQHSASSQEKIKERLAAQIAHHYEVAPDPIVVKAAHPLTGTSWDWLLMLAMRGDFKNRKQAGGRVANLDDGRPEPKFWRRYVTELQQIIDEGTFSELAYPGRPPRSAARFLPDYAKEEIPA